MADYYSVIATNAVSRSSSKTDEARRAIYECARYATTSHRCWRMSRLRARSGRLQAGSGLGIARGVMIEAIMYFGIGFLVATLLGLLFIPLVHNRAARLTTKRLEASTPLSMVEIRADRDHLRAEFAISTRRLEMTIEELKAKTSTQLPELGKKTDAINQLKKELAEKKVTSAALEARDRTLRDQLRATEKELQMKSNALLEADRQLADNQAELAKMWAGLGKRSLVAS
jgi:hypothetical protein